MNIRSRAGTAAPAGVALLVHISRLYYERAMTQDAIARSLRLSRPTVSRALERARALGIVQIRIHDPEGSAAALGTTLARRFGLRDVVLAEGGDPATPGALRSAVARAGAEYLQARLRRGTVIGVTWGRTLRELVAALKPTDLEDVSVVQMLGGLGVVEEETTGLAEDLARVLGARVIKLLAPAVVASEAARSAIAATAQVRQGLRYLREIRIAVVGIGAATDDVALVERGYVTRAFMRRMRRLGAQGEILVQFLSARGRILAHPRCRVIGFPLRDLPKLPLAIGVAAGPPDKSAAVLAALRARLLHVLITDVGTAQRVLALADAEIPPAGPRRRR
jgi:deoxyribonucleoside regulator